MNMVSVICSGWDDGSIRSDKSGRWKMIMAGYRKGKVE